MAIDFNKLWKEARTTEDEAGSVRALAKILSSKDGRTFILNLEQTEAELCIEILDHGLAEHKLHASEKQTFFGTLRRLAGKHARLPDSMVITDNIDFSSPTQPQTSGGFADIKPGRYKGHTVAVKTLRVAMTDNFEKIRKQFCKEVVLWNSLSHPNVLKLVGVLGGIEQYPFATVSEWMVHGNIMQYIRRNATNRLELLYGAVQGLKYLHDANLTHGDLKGANILMTNDTPPRTCLADFGFTTMVLDPFNPMSSSLTLQGGTMTFMAPELLAPSKFGQENAVPTREGDIYAFGLVILQVLTGELPFRNIKPLELAYHVSSGVRPDRPLNTEVIGISNSLWKLIQKCWDGEKTRRPRVQEVVEGVGNAATNWHTDMPPSVIEQSEDSVAEEDSDELKHVGIFQSYKSEDTPPADLSTDEPVFEHLNQNNPPPPTAIPPRKRKGFKYFLNKVPAIFGRKSRH
ncbi:kinase-like protein [Thelephora ganbajun]|uniref:Kinase-like protein n=1 Tax=Thelephora ganbajun TaxID=370292 RepID=A0ACB6Z4C4_THEGA|nr:kinase-like protein [Thelephora ganbajun]